MVWSARSARGAVVVKVYGEYKLFTLPDTHDGPLRKKETSIHTKRNINTYDVYDE